MRAFASTPWSEDATLRTRALFKLSEIRANSRHLAEILTTENGKTIRGAGFEVNIAADFAEYYGG